MIQVYIWMVIGASILLLIIILLFSSVRIDFRYQRKGENDEAVITFFALGRLIRYQKKLSQWMWEGVDEGIKYKTKQQGKPEEKQVTQETLERAREFYRLMIDRIDHFVHILKQFLHRVTCEKLQWKTFIGTGDAAETGILVGVAWGVKTNLIAMFSSLIQWKQPPEIEVFPCYAESRLDIDFHSVIRFRIGYALLALQRILFQLLMKQGIKKEKKPVSFWG